MRGCSVFDRQSNSHDEAAVGVRPYRANNISPTLAYHVCAVSRLVAKSDRRPLSSAKLGDCFLTLLLAPYWSRLRIATLWRVLKSATAYYATHTFTL